MEIKTLKTVWVAEDHDVGEIICVTQKFEDMIDVLINKKYLYLKWNIQIDDEWKSMGVVSEDNWAKIFAHTNAKRVDFIISHNISFYQTDLVEVIR